MQISGYAPNSNHVFALLIFMPPDFSLKPDFKSINFYQNKAKIMLFLQKKKFFFERWGLRTQTPNGIRRKGRNFQTPKRAAPYCTFLVTRQILNVRCDQARSQKFEMGGLCWGSGGGAPAAGNQWGSGGKAPSRRRLENFAFFCKNNFILGLFWLKNKDFKTWLRNWKSKHD